MKCDFNLTKLIRTLSDLKGLTFALKYSDEKYFISNDYVPQVLKAERFQHKVNLIICMQMCRVRSPHI